MVTYAAVKTTGLLAAMFGGPATLGVIAGKTYPAVLTGVPGEVIGLVVGVALIGIAALLPHRIMPQSRSQATE